MTHHDAGRGDAARARMAAKLPEFDETIALAERRLAEHQSWVKILHGLIDSLRRQRAAIAAPIDNDTRKDPSR